MEQFNFLGCPSAIIITLFIAYLYLLGDNSFYLLTPLYANYILAYFLSSFTQTESEESVRVAKSAKTRAFESFEALVSKLRNAMKTNDHKSLMDEFELLTKAMTKSTKVFDANGGIPRFLVRMLCDLEDHVLKSLADKASFKKLKPAQGRALNRMKLNLKN